MRQTTRQTRRYPRRHAHSFCRNNTAYVDVGNLGLSIKALSALVERSACPACSWARSRWAP